MAYWTDHCRHYNNNSNDGGTYQDWEDGMSTNDEDAVSSSSSPFLPPTAFAIPLSQESHDALGTGDNDQNTEVKELLKRRVSMQNDDVGKRRRLCAKRPPSGMNQWISTNSNMLGDSLTLHRVEQVSESFGNDGMDVDTTSIHESRNQPLEPQQGSGLLTSSLHQQIVDQFDQGSQRLLRDDRYLLDDHVVQDILQEDLRNQREWLELVVHARNRAKAWDATQYTRERNVLKNWLVVPQPHSPDQEHDAMSNK